MKDKVLILTCEHATNFIPSEYNNLGLNEEQLSMHIAYDKGCKEITEKLSQKFNCPAFFAQNSRLLIDCNRRPSEKDCILEVSDKVEIAGNVNISEAERKHRIETYYNPYHKKIADKISEIENSGKEPLLFSIHGFTPQLSDGIKRPWEAGLLFYDENDVIKNALSVLDATGMNIGRNEPYDIRKYDTGVCAIHCKEKGYQSLIIEIRADEFDDFDKGVDKWVEILANMLKNI